jgi:uncharacterized phiE125 gp8 family phage protein
VAQAVTLDDVKLFLGVTRNIDDSELVATLDDAVSAIEDVIGRLSPATVVEQFDSHGPAIVLSKTPVVSVDSVSIEPWLGATPVDDTAAWRLNSTTGILRRQLTGGTLPFYGRGSIFTVTYRAGRTNVPDAVNRAILMQVKSMWTPQRGAMPLPAGGDQPPQMYAGAAGFLGPGVMELLTPHLPPPGAA